MILYLDSSSLVKLYVEEVASPHVWALAEDAELLATSRVTLPEVRSALTRRARRGDLRAEDHLRAVEALEADWASLVVLEFDERQAASYVGKHGLRGFDSVHLSSALLLAGSVERDTVLFSSYDHALNAAAAAEGLQLA